MHVPALLPSGEYRSRDIGELAGVDGLPLASVSQVPPLLIGRTLREMSRPAIPVPVDVMREAGRLFATAELEGESPDEYARRHALATGVPVRVARSALRLLPERLARIGETVDAQRPVGAGGAVRWVPRARVLGVIAPSNHPLTHIGWLQALAFGYAVAVRPGSRDPFTPLRLARSLVRAGVPQHQIAVLPSPRSTAEALAQRADLGLVYGDEPTVGRYRGSARHLVRGPGCTKAVLLGGTGPDEDEYVSLLDAVAGDGGVRCTNVSAVFVAGDHASVAEELAARLAKLPSLPVLAPGAALPVRAAEDAARLRAAAANLCGAATDVTAGLGEAPLAEVESGQTVLRPAVLRVDDPAVPLTGELPFPCVWVAPWTPERGTAPLRDSLAVQVLGPDRAGLVDALLAEPSVRTVIDGPGGDWWSDPLLPHDGYLGHFLLEARGYVGRGGRS